MPSNNSPTLTLECNSAWQLGTARTRRIVRVTWQSNGEWVLQLADGDALMAMLQPESWVMPWGWHLRWRLATGGIRTLMCWRWQFGNDVWQQWRLRLAQQGTLRRAADT